MRYEANNMVLNNITIECKADNLAQSDGVIVQPTAPTYVGTAVSIVPSCKMVWSSTGTGNLRITCTRKGQTVYVQCSGRTSNTDITQGTTIITLPVGYRPAPSVSQETGVMCAAHVNEVGNQVATSIQILQTGVVSPMTSAISSGDTLYFGCTYLTDDP
jgi:hypothetical protein